VDIERVRDRLARGKGVSDWFLRVTESDALTVVRLPHIVTAREGSFSVAPNAAPREVIEAPTREVWVTVYSKFVRDGVPWLGEAVGQVTSGAESAIDETIAGLVASARGQKNRPFALPDSRLDYPDVRLAHPKLVVETPGQLLEEIQVFNGEVIHATTRESFVEVSNLEVFVRRDSTSFETSTGISLDYRTTRVDSEICFIARPSAERVGEHTARLSARRFADLRPADIVELYAGNARLVALAGAPPDYQGPVVLEGEAAADALAIQSGPFAFHSQARMVFEKTSRYEKGRPVHGDAPIRGEPLNLVSDPLVPYGVRSAVLSTADGGPPRPAVLVEEGHFQDLLGTRRYFEYLGLPGQGMLPPGPTGNTVVPRGRTPIDELKEGRLVVVKSFSAWEVDPASGSFACEIRLGELHDHGRVKAFTGGLLIGDYFTALGDATYSEETVQLGAYYGPTAIRFGSLKVAG